MEWKQEMDAPVLLLKYGLLLKWWVERIVEKIQNTEMRFLRWIMGCTRFDHIRNQDIKLDLNVNLINQNIHKDHSTGCNI